MSRSSVEPVGARLEACHCFFDEQVDAWPDQAGLLGEPQANLDEALARLGRRFLPLADRRLAVSRLASVKRGRRRDVHALFPAHRRTGSVSSPMRMCDVLVSAAVLAPGIGLTLNRRRTMLDGGPMVTVDMSGNRDGYAHLGDVRLHYVEAGEGPLVVLLHGFPEFWFSWRFQIRALAVAGFRVVAPDMRGYNLSSHPTGVAAYDMDRLAADVRDLIRERGAETALLAGHDWGAAVAWATAMNHPEVVERLAILNVPHPRRFLHGVRRPRQFVKSWYMFFFQLPWLPERLVRAARWWLFRYAFEHDARPGAFTPQDIERYIEAWSQPGAVTGNDQLLPRTLPPVTEARRSSSPSGLSADDRDLGRARPLSRRGTGRA